LPEITPLIPTSIRDAAPRTALEVEVKAGDKSALRDRTTHTAPLWQYGKVTSTVWAFGEGKIKGLFTLTFNFGSDVTVTPFSQVAASITELDTPNRNPFLGQAVLSIDNVVPYTQRVVVLGNVQYGSPLDFRVNLIIAN
jgi:hypothetical protein